jgi:hypothetical protein
MAQVEVTRSIPPWRVTANRRALLLGLGAAGIGPLLGRGRTVAKEATPTPVKEGEILLHTTFVTEELPGNGAECILYRLMLHPGVATSVLAGPYCGCPGQTLASGVGAEVVVSGSYAVRSDGPFVVRRADSPAEDDLPSRSEATLGPGDAAVYLDYGTGGEFRNAGTGDLVVLGVAILTAGKPGGTPVPELPDGVRAQELNHAYPSVWKHLPAGPVTVDLRRLTLAPGEGVTLPSTPGLDAASVEAGEITWAEIPAGQEAPSSPPSRYGPSGRRPFERHDAGTRHTVENNGDEPATVLLLSVVPGDDHS